MRNLIYQLAKRICLALEAPKPKVNLLFEPQTGNIFELGQRGYEPEWILV